MRSADAEPSRIAGSIVGDYISWSSFIRYALEAEHATLHGRETGGTISEMKPTCLLMAILRVRIQRNAQDRKVPYQHVSYSTA